MQYIQHSPIHIHGNLKSSNVLIDSRWTSKVTDHGLFLFKEGQEIDVEAGREVKYYGMFINNRFMANVGPSSYECTWEVAKHERTVRVARGDSREPLLH